MENRDPIVDEVRTARDAIAKEHGNDIKKIADAMRIRESQSGRRVVVLPPRRPAGVRKAS
jgi:hypothetical protein